MRVLKINDIFPGMDLLDEKRIIQYFKNEYKKLELQKHETNLLFQPSKEYELFLLDAFGGKVYLIKTNKLPLGDNRELYYSFDIANKIYEKTIDIQDSTINDYEEIKDLYQKEILQIENEIEELKKKDNEEYERDINVYNLIKQTSIYENYKLLSEDKDRLLEENESLNNIITDYNKIIKDLSRKLMIALERVELLQKPKTIKDKLKDLFKNDRKKKGGK